jgi:hypothetical protein
MATFWTNRGKQGVNDRTRGVGTEAVFCAVGTGAGAASATSTALSTEVETRASGTSSTVTTTTTGDTYQVVGTVAITATRTITNIGNFDASTVGNIDIIQDGLSIGLSNGDSLQATYKRQYT